VSSCRRSPIRARSRSSASSASCSSAAELLDLARAALKGGGERDADRADDHHRSERLDERRLCPALVERGQRDGDEADGGGGRRERDRATGVRENHRDGKDDERQSRLRQRPAARGDQQQDEADVGERNLDSRRPAQAEPGERREPDRIARRDSQRRHERAAVIRRPEQDRDRDDDRAADPQPGECLGCRHLSPVACQPVHGPSSIVAQRPDRRIFTIARHRTNVWGGGWRWYAWIMRATPRANPLSRFRDLASIPLRAG
jgi:hypothetical protein